MLSGSILGVWSHVEGVFNRNSSSGQRMQIVRVRAPQKRLVGECSYAQISSSVYNMCLIFVDWLIVSYNSSSHCILLPHTHRHSGP